MKRIYYFMSLLLSFGGVTASQAESLPVVTKLTQVGNLADITADSKLVFYNVGRKQYLMQKDADDAKIYLNSDFSVNAINSTKFVWSLEGWTATETEGTSAIKSYYDSFIPTLAHGGDVSLADEGASFTFTINNDSTFNIFDGENYFNGNAGSFTGWNETGGNSAYKIFVANVEEVSSVTLNFTCDFLDAQGESLSDLAEEKSVTAALNDSVALPSYTNFDMTYIDHDLSLETTKVKATLDGDNDYMITYTRWPKITVNMLNADADDEAIDSREFYVRKGQPINLPASAGSMLTLVKEEGQEGLVANHDTTITCRYSRALPFETTTVEGEDFAPNTKFYTMTVRGKYVAALPADETGEACPLLANIPSDSPDSLKWCFVGDDENGYAVYNKAAGVAKALYSESNDNGAAIGLSDAENATLFSIASNGNGFSFKAMDTDNAYWNDFGQEGKLKYWVSGAAATDVGGKILFTLFDQAEADKKAEAAKFAGALNVLRAADCVGGWASTNANMVALQTAYDSKDLDGCDAAIASLKADPDTIAFDMNKSYYIESAYIDFIKEQLGSNVKAIYATEDGGNQVAAWKDKEVDNTAFLWNFEQGDSTTLKIQNVKTGNKMCYYIYGQKDTLTTEGNNYTLIKCDDEIFVNSPASWQLYVFKDVNRTESGCLTVNSGVSNPKATEGLIGSYKLNVESCGNYWRLRPVKRVEVGIESAPQTVTAKSNKIFDLSGRIVKNPSSGLYIVNGKTTYIK